MNIEQRLALLQLGTHFLFDRNHVPEEVALIISNAFKLEKGKQKYENYKGAHQVKLEEDGLSVEIDGVSIMLTQIEYKYFELLYKKRNTVVVYQEIRETLWKDKEKTEFYANNITFLLRNKLRRAGFGHLIETIRSKGYRLRC
ncbi:helix-turn-helix domain-containing protein [Enterococcus termitis]